MIPTTWKRDGSTNRRTYPLLSLFDEMNRFWDEAVPVNSGAVAALNTFNPKFDLKVTPTEFVITGEFPGMKEKEITLTLKDNTLTLSGEKRSQHEEKEGERLRVERTYGSFSRTIEFDVEIDEDKASAVMENGLLTIKIPKSAKEIRGAKTLSIKAA